MWIFKSPKDYAEMVEKIAKSAFVTSLLFLYFLSCANKSFAEFLQRVSFGVQYEFAGIKLNLATFYFPLAIGLLEHIFKIHDKLSSLLGIRKWYDKEVIVKAIITGVNNPVPENLGNEQVKRIMSSCFYEYVSSTRPVIDEHIIVLTLNQWCWFWIALDTSLLFVVMSVLFLIIKWSWLNLVFAVFGLLLLLVLMYLIIIQTKRYTKSEINLILSDSKRIEEVKHKVENALQNK